MLSALVTDAAAVLSVITPGTSTALLTCAFKLVAVTWLPVAYVVPAWMSAILFFGNHSPVGVDSINAGALQRWPTFVENYFSVN